MDMRKIIEKKQKKKKSSPELDEMFAQLQDMYDTMPSPRLLDTLPVKFALFLYNLSKKSFSSAIEMLKPKEKIIEEDEDEEPVIASKQKPNKSKEHLDLNPKKIEKSDIRPVVQTDENVKRDQEVVSEKKFNNKKEWSDKEKSDLIKSIAKYPAGTSDRWVKISELVGRQAAECIQMEKLMKTDIKSFSSLNLNSTTKHKDEIQIKEQPTTAETRTFELGPNVDQWSQEQQTLLENCLKEFNKDTPNRWDRIAEKVVGKNKVILWKIIE